MHARYASPEAPISCRNYIRTTDYRPVVHKCCVRGALRNMVCTKRPAAMLPAKELIIQAFIPASLHRSY